MREGHFISKRSSNIFAVLQHTFVAIILCHSSGTEGDIVAIFNIWVSIFETISEPAWNIHNESGLIWLQTSS